ncbi:MAG: TetR/AcrR family transcriptional regulator [Dissulfurimicrobium sp.]
MMDIRPTRRERERLAQRQEMLIAALELFSEKGYHNVSMHEIAERSEFAIGTLYKFFKNKEDLYRALMLEKAMEFHDTLNEVLSRDDDVLAVVRDYVVTKARLFADNIPILRLYFAETQGVSFNIKAGIDQDIRKLHRDTLKALSSVMEKGVRTKVFRSIDPHHLALALEGLTRTFLFFWLEELDRHAYGMSTQLIVDLFLNGSLARDRASENNSDDQKI